MLGIEIIKRFGSGVGDGSDNVNLLDDAVVGQTYAQWIISLNGFTYKRDTSGAAAQAAAWINPQSGMDEYEVRATVATGDTPPGTIGSWLSLASTHTWGWTNQTAERKCNLTIEIRRASDSVVVDSATITLFAAGSL